MGLYEIDKAIRSPLTRVSNQLIGTNIHFLAHSSKPESRALSSSSPASFPRDSPSSKSRTQSGSTSPKKPRRAERSGTLVDPIQLM